MNKIVALALTTVLAIPSLALADTGSGTLTVTGTVASSIGLTIESAGASASGTGTAAATSALGTVSKFGAAPTGFTKATGASNYTLSSTVGVKVTQSNSASATYTLTAQLGTAPATGIVWKVNGSALNDSTGTAMTATGDYASTDSYAWDIVVADTSAAAAIDNTINFTATAN